MLRRNLLAILFVSMGLLYDSKKRIQRSWFVSFPPQRLPFCVYEEEDDDDDKNSRYLSAMLENAGLLSLSMVV